MSDEARHARPTPRLTGGSYLAIGLVALLLHTLSLGTFVAGDEVDFWIPRSEVFLEALQSGDAAATAVTTHPGVTTMWLGAGGIVLRHALRAWGVLQETPFPTLLALMRLPVALTHVAGVLLGYALLRRLLPAPTAALAALLWATDPFVLAFNRVLHVDGLMGTFTTLSLLAAGVSWSHTRRGAWGWGWGWMVLSGIGAGLAILSKSPALLLLPAVAAATLWYSPRCWWWLFAWGAACLATVVLVWPALWADPARVYQLLRVGVEVEGGSPHMFGNFFLGRPDPAPGPLFYPVALALRTTPWTLAGVLLLPFAFRGRGAPGGGRGVEVRSLATLAGFIILFVLAMSFFPKKFNRYLVPVFPALDILAAVGLVWGGTHLVQKAKNQAQRLIVGYGSAALLMAAALLNAAWYHPYEVAYFNQVLGGAPKGAQTFVVGWGEGYDQVAAFLNQQTDITGVVTLTQWRTILQPYLRHGSQAPAPKLATPPTGPATPSCTSAMCREVARAPARPVLPP
ncbi:MAG: phospholipid carrier-dependent glycosyltransferase, partial [Chloroflexaceae bacterium]|nr:phospholipid carrier-dependent glycosyltransferase [Chloroflexaceae bacterium]